MFDYRMTDEQEEYQRIAHEFARDEIRPISLELDHQQDPLKCAYMPHLLEKLDKTGLRTMSIPKEYGGGGVDDLLTHCIVGEEISWGDRGATGFMLSSTKISHILTSELLGDPELADYWMREYVSDPTFLIGTATTEPASGSENQIPYNGADGGYQTTAVLDGDNYIVNGKKHFISNVGWARLMFTFVRTNPDVGVEQGASLLMVPMDTPGVRMGKAHNKMGYRLNQNAEIIFENAVIPAKYRLGPENCGVSYIRRHLRGDALINAAGQIGVARAAYEKSLEFAQNRHPERTPHRAPPVGRHQARRHVHENTGGARLRALRGMASGHAPRDSHRPAHDAHRQRVRARNLLRRHEDGDGNTRGRGRSAREFPGEMVPRHAQHALLERRR